MRFRCHFPHGESQDLVYLFEADSLDTLIYVQESNTKFKVSISPAPWHTGLTLDLTQLS